MSPPAPRILARFTPHRGLLTGMCLFLLLFAVAAALALVAFDADALPGNPLIARAVLWLVVVLCPVYAADMLARIIRRTPTLVATEEGLVMRSIAGFTAPIPWDEIAAIAPVEMSRKLHLAIQLKDPRASFARLGPWGRLVFAKSHAENVPNITFRAIQLGTNPIAAAETLEGLRRARAAERR